MSPPCTAWCFIALYLCVPTVLHQEGPSFKPSRSGFGVGSLLLMCHCAAGGPGPVMSAAPSRPISHSLSSALSSFAQRRNFVMSGGCNVMDGGQAVVCLPKAASKLLWSLAALGHSVPVHPTPIPAICVCYVTWPRVRDGLQIVLHLLHLTLRPTLV